MIDNQELNLAFEFVQYTDRHIFLTGKAGTGKTTFLHSLKKRSPKRMVVVAPTGVAAINAGGVTIHSFFQLPFGPILPGRLTEHSQNGEANVIIHKFSKKKINIIRSIDLLVIDEVSMVRADLLDGIDQVLRRFRNKNQAFGGVQLLMIGDLQQLPPVVKQDEWQLLRTHYSSMFFFSSHAFQKSNPVTIELKHIYRQQEEHFIRILNEIRDDRLTPDSIEALNKRYIPGFRPGADDGYIMLTTHNAKARRINDEELGKLTTPAHTIEAEVWGNFPEYSYPADPRLTLKEGARVMFIKNDRSPEKRYFNGKTGRVAEIGEDHVFVICEGEEDPIEVEKEMWENIRYSIHAVSKQIQEEVVGTYSQVPLRLAWAITIHKSQGLTFEKAVIDAQAAFAHGQTYVALSRCRTLDGLVISTPITEQGIIQDSTVLSFSQDAERNSPDEKALNASKRSFVLALLEELFLYRQVEYHIGKGLELATEHASILLGSTAEVLRDMKDKGTRALTGIGLKFLAQLKTMTRPEGRFETSEQFSERVQKAGLYFLEKMESELLRPLAGIAFETDNQTVEKELEERLLKIRELLEVKKACLLNLKRNFDVIEFLNARAIASVQDYSRKGAVKKAPSTPAVEHPVLMQRLRAWRTELAREQNLPAYRVAAQKLLVGIANTLPADRTQLTAIKGMGPKKINQFGDEILAIVNEYRMENELTDHEFPLEVKVKKEKKHTRLISFEMYQEGRTIPEIAKERKLHEQTIEGHLLHFVAAGELDISSLVEEGKVQKITEMFNARQEAKLSELKEALGEEISWGELKFVRASLAFAAGNKTDQKP